MWFYVTDNWFERCSSAYTLLRYVYLFILWNQRFKITRKVIRVLVGEEEEELYPIAVVNGFLENSFFLLVSWLGYDMHA